MKPIHLPRVCQARLMNMEPTGIKVQHWNTVNYLLKVCQMETCEHGAYLTHS
jgi:hypothetical protein